MKPLELAFKICPMPMLLVDGGGKIVLSSEDFDQMFEYETGELIGQSVDRLVPDSVRDAHPQLRQAYLRKPAKRDMGRGRDMSGVTKSGRVFPLELGLNPITMEGEQFAIVAAIDISQRKAMEARIRAILNASASAIVLSDDSGKIVFVNTVALRLFGYSSEELLGQSVECLVPERARVAHPVYRRSYMEKQDVRPMGLGNRLYAQTSDGSEVPVEIALTPVETQEGKLVMCTIIDLTERVSAEQEMEAKALELEQLNIDLSSFANSASHDLKAPLSSISGLLRICIEDLEEGEVEEVAANLAEAAEISRRGAQKVENVLQIARAGQQKLDRVAIDLESKVRAIWRDLTASLKHPPELELDLNHGKTLVMEKPTLTTILDNLLSNAIRYGDATKDRHVVRVTSRNVNSDFELVVADNGLGITEENLKRVFEMFERLDERSGDGLGLALVRRQVERLNGSITVESTKGEGAEFRIFIPIQAEEEDA